MTNPLNKRIMRDIRMNKGKYIAIILLMLVTISCMSAFLAVSDGMKQIYDESFDKMHIEDGHFIINEQLTDQTIDKLEDLGIKLYNAYYKETDYKDTTLRIYTTREEINLVATTSGKLPVNQNEIALDRLYATNNKVGVEDDIVIADNTYHVSGLVALSDYSSLFKNNTDLMMDAYHFGVAVVSPETFEGINTDINYNYAYLLEDQNCSLKEKKELSKTIIEDLIIGGYEIKDICIQDENQSIMFVESDMGSDVPVMKVLMVLILLVISFIFAVLTKSTLEEESAIIGTLLASGYTRSQILIHYLSAPLLVTSVSAIIGNLLGYTIMLKPFQELYYTAYSLPTFQAKFSMEAFLLTSILPIAILLIINVTVLRYKLSLTPLQFLRRELGRKKDRKATRLPHTSFLNRFHLRVIIQNKYNYLILFFGVFLANILLLFGIGLKPLVNHYIDTIDENLIAQYQYVLKYPTELEESNAEKYNLCSLETYYAAAGKNVEVFVYGLEKNAAFVKKQHLNLDRNAVYVSDGLMKKLKFKQGDNIQLKDPYTEKSYNVTITGQCDYPANFAIFMDIKNFNHVFEQQENAYRGYFSNEPLEIDEDCIASIITADEMNSLGKQMMTSFFGMVPIVIGLALIIYGLFMYILTKMVIDKNSLFISYMKVFGYEDKEINRLYLKTTTIVVLCSLIFGVPLEVYAIRKCFEIAMVKINGYIEIFIPGYLLVVDIGIGIVTYMIINFFHVMRVRKIRMADALKARE